MARFDATELFGMVFGSFAAPTIFKTFGYYGSFGVYLFCSLLSLVYLLKSVKEPGEKKSLKKLTCVQPVKEMAATLIQKRPGLVRCLLFLQLLSYSLLWFNIQYESQEYLYLLKTFEGFTETQYSYYRVVSTNLIYFSREILGHFFT